MLLLQYSLTEKERKRKKLCREGCVDWENTDENIGMLERALDALEESFYGNQIPRKICQFTLISKHDSLDWKNPAPSEITKRVVENAQNGSIILFHNAAVNTPAALPSVIAGLKAKGFSFLPVSKLIYTENYTMDHTGRQIPNTVE